MKEINKNDKIKKLKDEIKYYKHRKNVTIAKNIVKGTIFVTPLMIPAVAIGGHFVLQKNIPGHIDYIEKHAYNTVTYSSTVGVAEKNTVYTPYSILLKKDDNTLTYYGPWTKQDDEIYIAKGKKYFIEDITENDLSKLVTKKDLSVEDILALSIKKVEDIEYKKSVVTEEELASGSHFEIMVHYEDKNDVVMAKETSEENSNDIGAIVCGVLLGGISEALFIAITRDALFPDTISYDLEEIKKNKMMIKELKKSK